MTVIPFYHQWRLGWHSQQGLHRWNHHECMFQYQPHNLRRQNKFSVLQIIDIYTVYCLLASSSPSISTMTLHWCNCLSYGHKWTGRWLRRPKSEAQILPQWGQTGPAGVAVAAACRRTRRSVAACSAAAARFFRLVAHVKLHRTLSSASTSSWDSGMLHFQSRDLMWSE